MSGSNKITVSADELLVSSGGFEYLSSGGVVVSTYTPTATDTISVLSGGTTEYVTVGSGGKMSVSSGSVDIGIVVSDGGILDEINSGTDITNPVVVYSGAEIEFGFVNANVNDTATYSGDVLTVSGGGRSLSITVSGAPAATYQAVNGKAGVVFTADSPTCYAGGTQILTEQGESSIETIKPGDQVMVRRNGMDVPEAVTWVGKSKIDLTRHAHPERAAPIRVKARALAENTPARDLVVSPEHCLILGNRCVPAKLLVNGGSIVREYRTEPFEYYHLELEKHGILIADGAEAESYLDTGNRSSFADTDAPQMLHPTFDVNAGSERWKTDACAPLASIEDEVAPLWQTLADRSAALGYAVPTPATVDDADLHILADGQRIQPMSDRDSRYVFTVPAGVRSVSLVSRFCIPADKMVSSLRDTRRLGVSVNWIAIRSGDHETILSADHPTLQDGWNEPEQAASTMWRWTNGAATIPWDNITGAAVVTVRCTTVDQYPVYDEKLALVA